MSEFYGYNNGVLHSSKMVRLSLLIAMTILISSCDSFWNFVLGEQPKSSTTPPVVVTKTQTPTTITQPVVLSEDQRRDVCVKSLASNKAIKKSELKDKILHIEVDDDSIKDELVLQKWIQDFAKDVFYTQDCPLNQITFVAGVTDESYYNGSVARSDMDFFRKGQISDAELYRRFEVKKTETEYSLKLKLVQLRKNGDHPQAMELVQKLIETDAQNSTLKIIQANIHRDQHAYAEAANLYQILAEVMPDDILVLVNFGYVQREMGNFPAAILNFKKALGLLEAKPDSKVLSLDELRLLLADTHFKNRELDLCREQLALVSDEAKDYRYHILHSNVLRLEKKFDESLAVLLDMETNGTADDLVLFNKTLLYIDLKNEEKSKQSYEELKQKKPAFARELAFLKLFGGDDTKTESTDETTEPGVTPLDVMTMPTSDENDTTSKADAVVVPPTSEANENLAPDATPATESDTTEGEEEMELMF